MKPRGGFATGQGQLSYTYHPATASSGAGLVQSITAPDGGILSYTYNGNLLHQEAWDGSVAGTFSGSVERAINNIGRISSETVNQTDLVTFGYDEDGFLTRAGSQIMSRSPQNGLLTGSTLATVSDTITPNGFGEVVGYSAAASANPLLDITYERDVLGRIWKKTESVQGGAPEVTCYRYDAAGRLDQVCGDPSCNMPDPIYECPTTYIESSYSYDSNSNRTGGFNGVSGSITATYDNQDRLLSYNGANYTYTANGELLTKTDSNGTTTYTYDAMGNLRRVVLPDATVIGYLIDGRDRRIGKKINDTLVQAFLYEDQLRIAAELDGSGNIISRFVYGEKVNVPEYVLKAGVTCRIITDHLGSPRLVVNASTGAIVQRMDYDEFGNVVADSNPGWQPFGFAGGLYDQHSRLTRFGTRDYEGKTGRWSAKDLILFEGLDTLLYGYVFQDPVNGHDPTGSSALTATMLTRGKLSSAKCHRVPSDVKNVWLQALRAVLCWGNICLGFSEGGGTDVGICLATDF